MNTIRRWARWTAMATSVFLLFLLAAIVGGWSPDLRRLTTSVHVLGLADYRADLAVPVAPLSPRVVQDAAGDLSAQPGATPSPSASGSRSPKPSPSGSGGPTPTPTVLPTLPTPTPTLPIPTPTLPVPTPTLPIPTPTPTLPLPTPPLP
jgi:hypothetical protein